MAVAAGLCVAFHPLWQTGDLRYLLGRSDIWLHTGPYLYYMDQCIQRGELPLWNPLIYCGLPFAANPITMTFYPPNTLRSALSFIPTPLNAHVGLAALVAIHFLFAGLFTFAFVRRLGLHRCAGLAAAFGFAFSAAFMFRASVHVWLNFAVVWMPLILYFQHRAMTELRFARQAAFGILGGAALGMSLLVGFVQLSMYMAVISGAYWLLYRALHTEWRRGTAALHGRMVLRDGAVLAALFGAAAAIAFAVLYPGAELTDLSGRSKSAGLIVPPPPATFEYTVGKAAKLFAVYGGLGEARDIMASGAVVVMLALAACFGRRWREAATFLALTYIMFDLCVGPPFPVSWLMARVAPFEMTQTPRAAILLCFPLAVLAALGVEAAIARCAARRWAAGRTLLFAAAGGLTTYLVYQTVFDPDYFLAKRGVETSIAIVLIPGAAAILLASAAWLPARGVWAFVLAVLVLAEAAVWNRALLPFYFRDAETYPGSVEDLTRYGAYDLANRRGLDPRPNMLMYQLRPAMTGYEPVNLGSVGPMLRSAENEGVYDRQALREMVSESHWGNLLFKRFFWLSRQYADGALPSKDELFPSATTAYLLDAPALPVPQAPRDATIGAFAEADGLARTSLDVARISAALGHVPGTSRLGPTIYVGFPPLAKPAEHSALHLRVKSHVTARASVVVHELLAGGVRGDTTYLRTLELDAAAPEQTFTLPLPDFNRFSYGVNVVGSDRNPPFDLLGAELLTDTNDENGRIQILSWSGTGVSVRVNELEGPRILTFLDAAYPGWRAEIDGRETPIYRSSNAFKAVVVPAGTHDIQFIFEPKRIYIGLTISLIAFIAAPLLGLYLLSAGRRATA